jgi:hypothetical protein
MKLIPITFLAIFACFLFITCSKNDSNSATLQVKYNKWAQTGNLRMQLTGVIDDSRCPIHPTEPIDCFWEGEANGLVRTEIAGTSHELPFTIKGLCDISKDTCGSILDTLGYHFHFVSLLPYPDGETINTDYVLMVRVNKK